MVYSIVSFNADFTPDYRRLPNKPVNIDLGMGYPVRIIE